PARR
ncbi:hypothetical protein SM139_0975, partial [Stenotrophomonas maltophilia]